VKKSIALLIVALLVLPAFAFVAPVQASTGHPKLGYTNEAMDALWLANLNVTIKAGDWELVLVDGGTPAAEPAYFAIIFNATGYEGVDFSGQVFDLYMSRDGYSSLSADDKMYAAGFSVADLDSALKAVTKTNALLEGGSATFYIGVIAETQVLVGPIPFDITNDYNYVKIFDGTGTLVAVGGFIEILPSISLTPVYGPGGAYVCLSGTALAPNHAYQVWYAGAEAAAATVTTGADGKFQFCWNVKDLCENYCYEWYTEDWYTTIEIDLYDNETYVDFVEFDEYSRYFYVGDYPWRLCNESWIEYDVYVFDDLYINGTWWNPTSPVVATVDGIELGSVTPSTVNGTWEMTVTIPALSLGVHNVTLTNAGCKWMFSIDVNPTLFVTPEKGPIGTEASFSCYGFLPDTMYYLYWEDLCYDEDNFYHILNVTTGPDGQFNVSALFTVPAQYGGPHYIYATTDYQGTETSSLWDNYTAYTTFFVTPTITVNPSTISNDGSTFWVNVTGALVWDTNNYHYCPAYEIAIDNQNLQVANWGRQAASACGTLDIQLVAAGFRPGLHSVALYIRCPWEVMAQDWEDYYDDEYDFVADYHLPGFFAPVAYATFTVDTTGDLILADISSYIDDNTAILLAIEDDVATIQTDVGTIKASVTALDAKVTAIQGNVATVQTTLGTMTGTLTSLSGDMATVKTQVGTVNAKIATALPVDMMPVWIAVIFAIIAAIAAIYGVLVIRSKIAQ
jgi:hypothetical protein